MRFFEVLKDLFCLFGFGINNHWEIRGKIFHFLVFQLIDVGIRSGSGSKRARTGVTNSVGDWGELHASCHVKM